MTDMPSLVENDRYLFGEMTVVATDEMTALYQARRGVRPLVIATKDPTISFREWPNPRSIPQISRISLRRDGAPPLTFDGFKLFARASVTPVKKPQSFHVRQVFEIYLTVEAALVASLASVPSDALSARPVHSSARLVTDDCLSRFLRSHDPAAGWAWLSNVPMASSNDFATRLRRDLQALVAAALRAAPLTISFESGDK
ncbi:MAG: hypothetical protein ACFBSD_04105 [Paracoccaceae bacterium]